jgi:UDP-N-acetylglucosamine 1-carboxyvinyltransferase
MNTFRKNLRAAMRRRGMTQQQLADAVGTSQPAISRILSGRESLTLDRAERIAVAVGISLSELFSDFSEKSLACD